MKVASICPCLGLQGLVLAMVLGLGGCASEPVHYHTLLAPPPSSPTLAPPAPFLIELLPVGIPEQLDQSQLVVRQGASEVVILEGERWAGPLGDELRSALSAALSSRLGTQDVAGLSNPTNKPVMRIKLQIRRFDAWPGQRVLLFADWSLGLADAAQPGRRLCHGQFEVPAAGGYPELVQAQQQAIADLAVRMAADARGWAGQRQAECSGSLPEHISPT